MRISFFGAKSAALIILGTFATAFAPLLGDDQRNYLVIGICFIFVPIVIVLRFSTLGRDLFFGTLLGLHMLAVTLISGSMKDISSVGFTVLFGLAYLAFSASLSTGRVELAKVVSFLRLIILAFAAISVIQALTSFAGLPIPNLVLSKGLWSYNSLAVEPSHAGRSLAMTMLAYLILSRFYRGNISEIKLLRQEKNCYLLFSFQLF